MATINLGNIKFNWKGTYNAGTAYAVDDVVSYNGSSYVCIQASTNNLPTVTAYWDIMSSAGTNGTNGTDLSTTLTTQGDLVYRDGSGLQRLGAGTAGQVLQTGGSGANPSWGTVSSDFVKLAQSSNVDAAYIDFNGHFSSTYKTYKVFMNDVHFSSNNNDVVCLRFSTGGSYSVQSANYSSGTLMAYTDYNGSVGNGSNYSSGAYNADRMSIGRATSGTGSQNNKSQYEITIFNPTGGAFKNIFATFFNFESNHYNIYMPGFTGGNWENSTAVTGVRFLTSGGNDLKASNISLYGIK